MSFSEIESDAENDRRIEELSAARKDERAKCLRELRENGVERFCDVMNYGDNWKKFREGRLSLRDIGKIAVSALLGEEKG